MLFYVITNVIPCNDGKIDIKDARPITREEAIAMCRAMGINVVEDSANTINDLEYRLTILESTVRRLCNTVTTISCPTEHPPEESGYGEWNDCDIEILDNSSIVIEAIKSISEPPPRNDTMPAPHMREDDDE
jgi:hypothetical protein